MAISFAFSAEQDSFREAVREYSRKVLLPGYTERSKKIEYPWKEHRQIAEMGILGIGLPSEYGGTDEADYVALGIACEELGYGDMALAGLPVVTGLTGAQLAVGGTNPIKDEWLRRLIAGDVLVTLALTEPEAGSDAASMRTTATPTEGGYILNGEKTSLTFIQFAEAAIVYARLPGTSRSQGVTSFLVELDSPGVSRGAYSDMGLLPTGRGFLGLTDVFVPKENLLGEEGRGFELVMNHFDYSRAAIGLQCLGAARASLDETWPYTLDRHTFGKPLAANQGITLPLAEHETYLEAARWLCYRTLWLRQEGQAHTSEAAMGKWWGPRVAYDTIQTCLLVHGHLGYSDEFPFQQRMRDVFGYFIGDGTSEIQKLLIAREHAGPTVMGR